MTALARDTVEERVRTSLREVLALSGARVASFGRDTELFGALPELDSMAVANLFADLEDRLGIVIDDEDVTGDLLSTFGGLVDFAAAKTK